MIPAVTAVCHTCGGPKTGPLVPCKSCGMTPLGEERAVAWLFSTHHLNSAELALTAERIQAGERPDPSRALRDTARELMGARPVEAADQKPLSSTQLVAVAVGVIVFTPLVGLAIWWGWRTERPLAARQALTLTLPLLVVMTAAWVWLLTT